MRRMPQQYPNYDVRRERDRASHRRLALLLVCCVLLAVGFVVAARQQFAAVQYGYRSEELRRERERLLEEQRRLRLALEENSSPAQLERAAREMGLRPARAAQIGTGARDGDTASGGREADARRPSQDAARKVSGAAERSTGGGASAFVGSAAPSFQSR